MSKKFLPFISTTAAILFNASTAFATNAPAPSGFVNPDINPAALPQLIINLLMGVASFLALAYLMYGGIRWITSRGDKIAVESARKHVVAAVIGLVIVVGSFFILRVVGSILGAGVNPLAPTLPTLQQSAP